MRRYVTTNLVAGVLLTTLLFAGCAPQPASPPEAVPSEPVVEESGARVEPPHPGGFLGRDPESGRSAEASQAPPGSYPLAHDRTQVMGTLDYRDIAGGVYCIVDCYPWDDLEKADVLALVDANDPDTLYSLYERYASADGQLVEANGIPRLNVDEIVQVGETVPWSIARREKPNAMVVDEGLRVVGTLVFVEQYRDTRTDSWAVVDALDPASVASGLSTQHVLAFLDVSADEMPLPDQATYVEVYGEEVGARTIMGSRLPVVAPDKVSTLP